jgi:hypothetical protein
VSLATLIQVLMAHEAVAIEHAMSELGDLERAGPPRWPGHRVVRRLRPNPTSRDECPLCLHRARRCAGVADDNRGGGARPSGLRGMHTGSRALRLVCGPQMPVHGAGHRLPGQAGGGTAERVASIRGE